MRVRHAALSVNTPRFSSGRRPLESKIEPTDAGALRASLAARRIRTVGVAGTIVFELKMWSTSCWLRTETITWTYVTLRDGVAESCLLIPAKTGFSRLSGA